MFKFQGVATDYTYGSSAECVAMFLGLSPLTHIKPPNSQKLKSGSVNEKKQKTKNAILGTLSLERRRTCLAPTKY